MINTLNRFRELKINFSEFSFAVQESSAILQLHMDSQKYYESARQLVDDLIDDSFGQLSGEGNRKLARIWQYLRDQEIVAIQSKLRSTAPSQERFSPADFPFPQLGASVSR